MCILSKFCTGQCERCVMTWNTESITALSSGSAAAHGSERRGDKAAAPTASSLRFIRVWRRHSFTARRSTKRRKESHRSKGKGTQFPVVVTTTNEDKHAATLPSTARSSEEDVVHSDFQRSQYFCRSSWYRKPVRGPRSSSTKLKTKYPSPPRRVQADELEQGAAAEEPKREKSARLPLTCLAKPEVARSEKAKAATKVLASAATKTLARASIARASISSQAARDVHCSQRYSISERHSTVARESVIHEPTARRRAASCGTLTRPRSHRYAAKPRRRARRPPSAQVWRRPRKIVVIGDMCSGKSGLISAYCRDRFNDVYIPTILRSCLTDARVFGEKVDLVIVEVAGRDDYARLRRCAYSKMDIVILCYSADNAASLERIKKLWLPELKKHAPKVPYILVGTKKDAREECVYQFDVVMEESSGQMRRDELLETIVTTRQGLEVAKSIGAHGFVECSALYRDGTREVFETAAKVALRKSRRRRKCPRQADPCVIL